MGCLDAFGMAKLLPLILCCKTFAIQTFGIWCLDAWQNFSHADTARAPKTCFCPVLGLLGPKCQKFCSPSFVIFANDV